MLFLFLNVFIYFLNDFMVLICTFVPKKQDVKHNSCLAMSQVLIRTLIHSHCATLIKILDFLHIVLQAIRLSLEQALPPEPDEDSGEQISKLRIRTPSGEFLERRFLGSCKLQVLFDFVASKGYPFEEFKLLTTFPRRNVSVTPESYACKWSACLKSDDEYKWDRLSS